MGVVKKARPTLSMLLATGAVDRSKFCAYLQAELVERCRTNPRYSLRAFARFLELEPSALSKILAGKRRLTGDMCDRIIKRLAPGPEEIRTFVVAPPKGEDANEAEAEEALAFEQISLDAFQVIADWYHLAIVELARVRGFRGEPHYIARNLGITLAEAVAAVDRLLRLGMLARDARGKIVATDKTMTTTNSPYSSGALRRMQRQVLEKAIVALDQIPVERRDQSAMTLAVNVGRLKVAKERIRDFRRSLAGYLEGGAPKTAVYHLSISLYPVSNLD